MIHRSPSASSETDTADRGTILILTLMLTVILAIVVLALASWSIAGLKTSKVTTERNRSNAITSSSITWVVEEFAAKRVQPQIDCTAVDTVIPVPAGVAPSGNTSVLCSPLPDIGFHPAVKLSALGTTADGTERTISVVAQVPREQYTVQVRSWTAD